MANNEILPFSGTDTGTNLLTQAEYLADSQRSIGNQPGIARSKLVNKVLKQTSLIASAIAEYISNRQPVDVTDSLTVEQIEAMFDSIVSTFLQSGAGAVGRTFQDKMREQFSIKDFGAVCDGVADDTAEVQAAIAAIGSGRVSLIIPGPTKFSSDLTFGPNTELTFVNGGELIGTAGTELVQIQRQMAAGPRQIFSNCLIRATSPQQVFPEWFGAKRDGATNDQPAFSSAIYFLQNTGGVIQMLPGVYAVASQVQITYNKICMQGAGNNITYIKALGSAVSGIGVYGVAGVSFVANVMLRDFSILSSAGGVTNVGLDLQYTAFCIVERMQIQDFIVGLQMMRATNSQITKVGATYTGGTNGFVGFNILGGGTTGGNASSIMKDCYSSGMPLLTGQIGFQMTGVYMSDFQFDNCEVAVTNYGYYIDYQNAPLFNEDVIIRNPIVDRFTIQGILVNRLPSNGSLSILGGWSNPATTATETDAIYLDNCAGLFRIADHQFCADTNYANATGVRVLSSIGYKIGGCTFKDQKYGVRLTGSGYGSISDSLFKNASGRTATAYVSGASDARTMVNGCTFDGYATQAVIFDASSSGSGIIACNANITNIPTRFTNGAVPAIGGADGSTGLNSGV